MTSFCDSHDYYKRMLDLQEKLRKSEEERIRLEERFKMLVQESRNRHDTCINRLRLRYIEFLEEQRTRDERNHKLLEALDRVDSSLALMTAKTDRLSVLRKQYEAYLHRAYAIRSPSESIVSDNDIVSQNRHRYRGNAARERVRLPSEVTTVSSFQPFQSNYQTNVLTSPASKFTQPIQNTSYNYRQPETVQSSTPNQQINTGQSTLQVQVDPTVQQLSSRNLTPQISHHRQPYYKNSVQLTPRNFRIDPSNRVPYVSTDPQINSLSQQNALHFNKSLTERMEPVQALPHLVKPERTNGNVLQYNSVDVPQKRFTSTILQHQINPSSVMQSFRPQNSEMVLDNLQARMNNNTEISPGFRTTPIITERNLCSMSLLNTPLNIARQPLTSYLDRSARNSERYTKSFNNVPTRSLRASDVDDTLKQHESFSPKQSLLTGLKQTLPEEDVNNKSTMSLDNELDRYIDKIRRLHHDHNTQSLEDVEHEQNTSGDILNASLSDEHAELSGEKKSKEDIPKEVEKVLALADDLTSGILNSNDVHDSGIGGHDENRNLESIRAAQSDTPISERSHTPLSGTHEGHATPEAVAKDKISGDIMLQQPKLDSRENIEKPVKQNSGSEVNIHVPKHCEQQQPEMQKDENDDLDTLSNNAKEMISKDTVFENVRKDEQYDGDIVHVGEESNFEQYSFDGLEKLEPWNLVDVQERLEDINVSEEIEDQSMVDEPVVDVPKLDQDDAEQTQSSDDTAKDQMDKLDSKEDTNVEAADLNGTENQLQDTEFQVEENSVYENVTKADDSSSLQNRELEQNNGDDTEHVNIEQGTNLAEDKLDEQEVYGDKKEEQLNESNYVPDVTQSSEEVLAVQHGEYGDPNYIEESNQMQHYPQNSEAAYTDLNEQYNYDKNAAYDTNQGQEFQDYANQEYVQESNEQYEGYVNQQYEQYGNDPQNQYEHDPNVQYQEDPNQQYAYAYDQQYDPNQVYETDVNQPFAYSDTYDPNQAELVQESQQNEESEKLQEKSDDQEVEGSLEKADANQDKNEKLSSENEPKKKKDVIKSLLDSDTDSTIERNVSNTESDFDFN